MVQACKVLKNYVPVALCTRVYGFAHQHLLEIGRSASWYTRLQGKWLDPLQLSSGFQTILPSPTTLGA